MPNIDVATALQNLENLTKFLDQEVELYHSVPEKDKKKEKEQIKNAAQQKRRKRYLQMLGEFAKSENIEKLNVLISNPKKLKNPSDDPFENANKLVQINERIAQLKKLLGTLSLYLEIKLAINSKYLSFEKINVAILKSINPASRNLNNFRNTSIPNAIAELNASKNSIKMKIDNKLLTQYPEEKTYTTPVALPEKAVVFYHFGPKEKKHIAGKDTEGHSAIEIIDQTKNPSSVYISLVQNGEFIFSKLRRKFFKLLHIPSDETYQGYFRGKNEEQTAFANGKYEVCESVVIDCTVSKGLDIDTMYEFGREMLEKYNRRKGKPPYPFKFYTDNCAKMALNVLLVGDAEQIESAIPNQLNGTVILPVDMLNYAKKLSQKISEKQFKAAEERGIVTTTEQEKYSQAICSILNKIGSFEGEYIKNAVSNTKVIGSSNFQFRNMESIIKDLEQKINNSDEEIFFVCLYKNLNDLKNTIERSGLLQNYSNEFIIAVKKMLTDKIIQRENSKNHEALLASINENFSAIELKATTLPTYEYALFEEFYSAATAYLNRNKNGNAIHNNFIKNNLEKLNLKNYFTEQTKKTLALDQQYLFDAFECRNISDIEMLFASFGYDIDRKFPLLQGKVPDSDDKQAIQTACSTIVEKVLASSHNQPELCRIKTLHNIMHALNELNKKPQQTCGSQLFNKAAQIRYVINKINLLEVADKHNDEENKKLYQATRQSLRKYLGNVYEMLYIQENAHKATYQAENLAAQLYKLMNYPRQDGYKLNIGVKAIYKLVTASDATKSGEISEKQNKILKEIQQKLSQNINSLQKYKEINKIIRKNCPNKIAAFFSSSKRKERQRYLDIKRKVELACIVDSFMQGQSDEIQLYQDLRRHARIANAPKNYARAVTITAENFIEQYRQNVATIAAIKPSEAKAQEGSVQSTNYIMQRLQDTITENEKDFDAIKEKDPEVFKQIIKRNPTYQLFTKLANKLNGNDRNVPTINNGKLKNPKGTKRFFNEAAKNVKISNATVPTIDVVTLEFEMDKLLKPSNAIRIVNK